MTNSKDAPRSAPASSPTNRLPAPPPRSGEDLVVGKPVDMKALDPTRAASLLFDGYQLRWLGSQPEAWTAFSGTADESAKESEKELGPTPQGHFTIDPADIQYLTPSVDWGSHRVRLQPLRATLERMQNCFGVVRTGMYIHGGSERGTHGCIELNNDADEEKFFAKLKEYGGPIDIEVKYTGARKAAYEDTRCPY